MPFTKSLSVLSCAMLVAGLAGCATESSNVVAVQKVAAASVPYSGKRTLIIHERHFF